MTETTLYLVRHGQSMANVRGVFTGQADEALSPLGVRQAARVADLFRDIPIDAVYASDLCRAVQTVEPVAREKGLTVQRDPALREIFAGPWEGMAYEDIARAYPEDFERWLHDTANARCTDGESVGEMAARVFAAVRRIAGERPGQSVLIGTHATPVRAVISILTAGDVSGIGEVPWAPNGAVTVLRAAGDRLVLQKMAVTRHLDGLLTSLPGTV